MLNYYNFRCIGKLQQHRGDVAHKLGLKIVGGVKSNFWYSARVHALLRLRTGLWSLGTCLIAT